MFKVYLNLVCYLTLTISLSITDVNSDMSGFINDLNSEMKEESSEAISDI